MSIGVRVKVVHIISEEDIEQQEMGIDLDFSDNVPEEYTLYTIDYTKRYDKKRCIVSSAGFDFVVNESYESPNDRIHARQTFRFN